MDMDTIANIAVILFSGPNRMAMDAAKMDDTVVTVPITNGSVANSSLISRTFELSIMSSTC